MEPKPNLNVEKKNVKTPEEAIEEIEKEYNSKTTDGKARNFKVSENQKLVAYVLDFYNYGHNFPSSQGSEGHNQICIKDLENLQVKFFCNHLILCAHLLKNE